MDKYSNFIGWAAAQTSEVRTVPELVCGPKPDPWHENCEIFIPPDTPIIPKGTAVFADPLGNPPSTQALLLVPTDYPPKGFAGFIAHDIDNAAGETLLRGVVLRAGRVDLRAVCSHSAHPGAVPPDVDWSTPALAHRAINRMIGSEHYAGTQITFGANFGEMSHLSY